MALCHVNLATLELHFSKFSFLYGFWLELATGDILPKVWKAQVMLQPYWVLKVSAGHQAQWQLTHVIAGLLVYLAGAGQLPVLWLPDALHQLPHMLSQLNMQLHGGGHSRPPRVLKLRWWETDIGPSSSSWCLVVFLLIHIQLSLSGWPRVN